MSLLLARIGLGVRIEHAISLSVQLVDEIRILERIVVVARSFTGDLFGVVHLGLVAAVDILLALALAVLGLEKTRESNS